MRRGNEYMFKTCGYLLIGLILLLPVSCAMPQGGGGSMVGIKRGQQQPSDQRPPDAGSQPTQENRK
jgi:hypothetical protein